MSEVLRRDRPRGAGSVVLSREDRPEGSRSVICVHRAGGSARSWESQLAAIGEARQIVTVDLPGHGGAPGPALLTIEAMADAVESTMDGLGIEGALVVGHSMGGAVALALALASPERCAALLLLSSGARLRVATPILDTVRERFDMLSEVMVQMVFARGTPAEVIEAARPHLFDAPAEVVLADLEACDRFDAEPRLGELALRVRLMTGKEDYLTPPRLARRLASRVAGAELEVIEGAGHMLPLERPELVTEAILAMSRTEAANG